MGEMRGDRSIKSCSSYPLADRGNPYKPPLFLLLKKAPSRPHPPERRGRVSAQSRALLSSQTGLHLKLNTELLTILSPSSHAEFLKSAFPRMVQGHYVILVPSSGRRPLLFSIIFSSLLRLDGLALLGGAIVICFFVMGSVFIGNTQLALQIIKRNQLLPAVKTLSEMRKKPVFQPVHPIQPIQMPAFTVQRK